MAQIAAIQWQVEGDIGGAGISRFWFMRQDATEILGADADAAAAATAHIWDGGSGSQPLDITWSCLADVPIYDSATGLVAGPLVVGTLPPPVPGTVTGNYSAGVGARINWKTDTISTRRLIKGATFVVPLAGPGFTTSGAISSGLIAALNTGAAAYLAAMVAATLYPVIWHRPAKGTHAGGLTGIIFAGSTSSVPAGLRSRRT